MCFRCSGSPVHVELTHPRGSFWPLCKPIHFFNLMLSAHLALSSLLVHFLMWAEAVISGGLTGPSHREGGDKKAPTPEFPTAPCVTGTWHPGRDPSVQAQSGKVVQRSHHWHGNGPSPRKFQPAARGHPSGHKELGLKPQVPEPSHVLLKHHALPRGQWGVCL